MLQPPWLPSGKEHLIETNEDIGLYFNDCPAKEEDYEAPHVDVEAVKENLKEKQTWWSSIVYLLGGIVMIVRVPEDSDSICLNKGFRNIEDTYGIVWVFCTSNLFSFLKSLWIQLRFCHFCGRGIERKGVRAFRGAFLEELKLWRCSMGSAKRFTCTSVWHTEHVTTCYMFDAIKTY